MSLRDPPLLRTVPLIENGPIVTFCDEVLIVDASTGREGQASSSQTRTGY